jgi:hypothetical protein
MPSRYFFMHIPKTAGMVLYQRLIRHHGADAVHPLPFDQGRRGAYMDLDYVATRIREHPEIRVIAGHYPLCLDEVLEIPLTTITLLRDPVARALSMVRQHQQRDEEFRQKSLDDVYSDPVLLHGLIHNYMVRVLTMTPSELQNGVMTMVPYDEARLECAKHNLQYDVETFGLQEDFEAFCDDLESRFGWELGGEVTYSNRTEPAGVSDELRQRIAHDNALDVQLYQFAKGLLCHG